MSINVDIQRAGKLAEIKMLQNDFCSTSVACLSVLNTITSLCANIYFFSCKENRNFCVRCKRKNFSGSDQSAMTALKSTKKLFSGVQISVSQFHFRSISILCSIFILMRLCLLLIRHTEKRKLVFTFLEQNCSEARINIRKNYFEIIHLAQSQDFLTHLYHSI